MGSYKTVTFLLVLMLIMTLIIMLTGYTLPTIDVYMNFSGESNGNAYSYVNGGSGLTINLSNLQGAIAWITIIAGLGIAAGIAVLGTGLNDTSSSLAFHSIFFVCMWFMFSVLPLPYFLLMPGLWGSFLYLALTIVYAISCVMAMGGSDNG